MCKMFLFWILTFSLLRWTSYCFCCAYEDPLPPSVQRSFSRVKTSFVETVITVLSCALLWVLFPDLYEERTCLRVLRSEFSCPFWFFGFVFCQWLWHSDSNRHLFYYPKLLNKHIIVPLLPHCHWEWKAVRPMTAGMRRSASSSVWTLVSQTHQ